MGDLDLADLDADLRRRADADEFSGVVLARRGATELYRGAFGVASRRWAVPMTPDVRFDVASVTKLFTSVAALQLVDDERLRLDDRIVDLVDLAGTAIPPEVTVRQLLTHTSGIADDADEEADEDYAALFVDVPCYSVVELRDALPFFVHKPPVFPPGEGCRYCNAGFQLVGAAIETVTGRRFREVVVDGVFGRAGMARSGFFRRQDAVPDVAEGWDLVEAPGDGGPAGWVQNIFSYPPIGDAAGGAHVTASDLVTFLQAVRSGALLSAASTELFLTPQVRHHGAPDHEIWYGFGLEFVVAPDGGVLSYYKDGINAGASALGRHYSGPDLDVAVLSNSERGAWPVVDELHKAIRARYPEVGPVGL